MKLSDIDQELEIAVQATEAYFAKIEEMPAQQAMAAYYRFKSVLDDLGKHIKRLNKLKTDQQYKTIPDIMIRNAIRTHTDDLLNVRFAMQTQTRVKILDKPTAYDWLRGNGMGDIIVETVNAQTLGAAIKAYNAETRMDPPDEAFAVERVLGVTATKTKAKAKF